MVSIKSQDTDTVVMDNNNTPLLEGGHFIKNNSMWNLKHKISSPKFY